MLVWILLSKFSIIKLCSGCLMKIWDPTPRHSCHIVTSQWTHPIIKSPYPLQMQKTATRAHGGYLSSTVRHAKHNHNPEGTPCSSPGTFIKLVFSVYSPPQSLPRWCARLFHGENRSRARSNILRPSNTSTMYTPHNRHTRQTYCNWCIAP